MTVSRELGSKSRAPVPPLPEPSDQLTVEDIAQLEDIAQQLNRIQDVRDGAALQMLQTRLRASPLEKGSLRTYLETQLAEAQSALGKEDPVVNLLGELLGTSRALASTTLSCAVINDPNYPGRTRKAVFRNADAYRIDSITNEISLVEVGGRLVPKHSLEGLRARFGSVYINSGSFMEIQVDPTTRKPLIVNGQTVRTKPGKSIAINAANPDVVVVYERRVTGGWWRSPDITFADALRLNLEASDGTVGPRAWGATPIVAVTGEIQLPERTIALTAGSFTWSQINSMAGATSFQLILEAGGAAMLVPASKVAGQGIDPAVYAKARSMPGGATIKNIVAVGGGSYTIQTIVAGEGGNLIGDGAGTLSLIGQDGASLAVVGKIKVTPSAILQQKWSEANERAIAFDQGRFLRVTTVDARFIGVGVGSLKVGEIITPSRTVFSSTTNPYFRNATRLD